MLKGSEWRRWDLHVHTPFTQKNDQYEGKCADEKWDKFYKSIEDYIGYGKDPQRAICAIGITDYLSIDNYQKVVNDNRLPDCVKLLIPNVELRCSPVSSKAPLNIHCLFDPSIAKELYTRFFSRLMFKNYDREYSASKDDLAALGRKFKDNDQLSEEEAIHFGISQFVIDFNSLTQVFKIDPELREKVIIVVANSSTDGVSGVRGHKDYFEGNISQLDTLTKSIYNFADMIFSSKESDRNFFLGEGNFDAETIIKSCGSLKPCIHGSDAHTNSKLFAPAEDRFCWIKADPTFEGLKQVIYEPKDRVFIGSNIPEKKPDYQVIDRVEIKGDSDFSEEPIYFSDKLTCIIGSKSTGKSLLINNIAMAIDAEQAKAKQAIAKTNFKNIPEIKVYWRDGVCSDETNKQRKIVYIPQTYLNHVSDYTVDNQDNNGIDSIIQSILLQDQNCDQAYKLKESAVKNLQETIDKSIMDLLDNDKRQKDLINQCKEIGDEESLKNEIEKLQAEQSSYNYNNNLSQEDISSYKNCSEKLANLKNEQSLLNADIQTLQGQSFGVEIKPGTEFSLSLSHSHLRNSFFDAVNEVQAAANKALAERIGKIIEAAKTKGASISNEMKEQEAIFNDLQDKMEANEQLEAITNSLLDEQARLKELKSLKEKLSKLREQYQELLKTLGDSFGKFQNINTTYANHINNEYKSSSDDLSFSAKVAFNCELLEGCILDLLNKKTYKKFKQFDISELKEEDLSSANIEAFIESIINKDLQTKSNKDVKTALNLILKDWYSVKYDVTMDGDPIQVMSPGKKALVLLKLIIIFDRSNCPIIIDQPEDDLDNRSIFNQLSKFIKDKKKSRQIIVATHNANIVLGSDAELVIVANQNSKNSPNDKYRFEYRGGAIEDTNKSNNVGVGILNCKNMQEHICEILEGGEKAFSLRHNKYHFIKD